MADAPGFDDPQQAPRDVARGSNIEDEEIRTLFISGLPFDVKERELHNLFRPFEGYEGAMLKPSGSTPIAFASFTARDCALTAMEKLNGITFDPEFSDTLRIEFAKSNSRIKRVRDVAAEAAASGSKRPRASPSGPYGGSPAYGGAGAAGAAAAYYDPAAVAAAWASYYAGGDPAAAMAAAAAAAAAAGGGGGPPHGGAYGGGGGGYGGGGRGGYGGGSRGAPKAPNTTLFVANLSPMARESEITDALQRVAGVKRVKVLMKGGAPPSAFVEFADMHASSAALATLNGAYAPYADRSGLRVEYARSRMGQPGRNADPSTFSPPPPLLGGARGGAFPPPAARGAAPVAGYGSPAGHPVPLGGVPY